MKGFEAEVTVSNELGLHLRAAATLAKRADGFESEIVLWHGRVSANGKSVIALVTLAATKGSVLRITAEGGDAEQAVAALIELISARFGESR